MRLKLKPLLICVALSLHSWPAHAAGKTWFLGISALGGAYQEKQRDWNTLITDDNSSEGTQGATFHDPFRLYWGGQLEFFSMDFSSRFTLGLRYEHFSETTSGTGMSAENSAHLLQLIDSFYLTPFSEGFNFFLRGGVGYIRAQGSYGVNASRLNFQGDYFTAFGSGGLELLVGRFAIDVEVGYRYAVLPKIKAVSASGTVFSGISPGDVVLLISGATNKRFSLDYSGLFYAVTLKYYF